MCLGFGLILALILDWSLALLFLDYTHTLFFGAALLSFASLGFCSCFLLAFALGLVTRPPFVSSASARIVLAHLRYYNIYKIHSLPYLQYHNNLLVHLSSQRDRDILFNNSFPAISSIQAYATGPVSIAFWTSITYAVR